MERAIPDRLVFVWSGPDFPYHARLAVESALIAEPGCEVEIHLLDRRPPRGVHFLQVAAYERVAVAPVALDDLFAGLDAPAATFRALHDRIPAERRRERGDLVRLAILHRRGGVSLDFDVLVHRGLAELRRGPDFVAARACATDRPRAELRARWSLATPARGPGAGGSGDAVVGARAGSPFLRRVLAAALAGAGDPARGALGPTLVDRVARQSPHLVVALPPALFCCVTPGHILRVLSGPRFEVPAESRFVHFAHGGHRRLLARVDAAEALRRRRGSAFFRLAAPVAEGARCLPRRGASV